MAEKQKDDILKTKFTEALNLLQSGPQSSHREKAIDTLNKLQNAYYELSEYLAQASWVERVETIQGQATYIASIASVVRSPLFSLFCQYHFYYCYFFLFINKAVFLGAVQIAFIAYTATIFPTSKANSTVQDATNIFSSCALLFDVLGALFALITSGTLLLRASEAKKFTTTKQKLLNDIDKALAAFTDPPQKAFDPQEAQSTFDLLRESGNEYHTKALRLAHLIDDHSQGYFDVLLIIIAGVAFFFASYFLFVVSTQPFRVWLPTIVVTGITTVMLLYMQTHRHPGITFKAALGTTKWVFAGL